MSARRKRVISTDEIVSQNGQTPNIIGICSYCVLDRPVFEWNQVLLHPELTPWWSFLFADGAYHKKPHCPTHPQHFKVVYDFTYRQTCNINHTFVGNDIGDHSDVVGASPVGIAPSTSSFSTWHLISMDWANTTARRDEKHLRFGIWCDLH